MPLGSMLLVNLRLATSAGVAALGIGFSSLGNPSLRTAADADVELTSTAAIPLGGPATATVDIAASSTAAIPIGGTPTGTVGVVATSSRAIPIGGSATATNPSPFVGGLSDALIGSNGLTVNTTRFVAVQSGGTVQYSSNSALLTLVGDGVSVDQEAVQSKTNWDARNASVHFLLNTTNAGANTQVRFLYRLGGQERLGFRFVKTGAGAGTVTAEYNNRANTLGSAAYNPDADTIFKLDTVNTTTGVTDSAKLYKSNGAGGWTLVLDTTGSGTFAAELVSVQVAVVVEQIAALVETRTFTFDEFNTVIVTVNTPIPIGGSATGTVAVAGAVAGAIPLGGSATGTVAVAGVAAGAIPLGGSATGAVRVAGVASQAIPIGGSATGTVGVTASASGAIPLAGAATGTVALTATTATPIPIGGSATGTVAPMGTARSYWRILVLTNAGSFAPSFAEVEFRATVAGADQANGGTALASSIYSAGFAAALGFDNNNATLWSAATNVANEWLGYQFLTPVDVGEVFLRSRQDVSGEGPASFSVQYSSDGVTWTTLWTVTGQTWAGAGAQRAFAAPASTVAATSTLPIPIGGSVTGTVADPPPKWVVTDLGPEVPGINTVQTFVGLGPVAGLPRDNVLNTANAHAVFDGVDMKYDFVTVNPAGFVGIVGETIQQGAGTGFPTGTPLLITFATPIRGLKVTCKQIDFNTNQMVAKDGTGATLATVVFDPVAMGGSGQSITREILLGSNLIKTISLYADPTDWVVWQDIYLTIDHVTSGGWTPTDLDPGLDTWAVVDADPATVWATA